MSNRLEEIDAFAKSTLGGTPEAIKVLGILNEEMALEQFTENTRLYLGRTMTPRKLVPLIALAVSLAQGQKESTLIHYRLAKKFDASVEDILDIIKISKMALMASTLSTMTSILPVVSTFDAIELRTKETEKIMANVMKESGESQPPENLSALSKLSFDLFNEHLREKMELLSPLSLERKTVFLIAFSVSVSLRDQYYAPVYLNQYFRNGGSLSYMEDAISIARFVTGNKVVTTGMEMLNDIVSKLDTEKKIN
jgi:alkylhydroperoxidase/carboxymuconolactone decarboxylase family protein YurZ